MKGLVQYDWCPYKKRNYDTKKHKVLGDNHIRTQPSASQGGRPQGKPTPTTSWSQILSPRTVKQYSSVLYAIQFEDFAVAVLEN